MDKKQELMNHLVNWFEIYLKNRDIILRKIVSIEKNDNIFKVVFKDKIQIFYIFLNHMDINLELIKKEKNPSIVLINSPGNFSYLIGSWSKLIIIPSLSIYFVNPFSETDKKWIIFPYTHHQITENESLVNGLRSLYESVEQIDEDKYYSNIFYS
jgi:hypothetical protein